MPKSSLRRLNFRSFRARDNCRPYGRPQRSQWLLAVFGFPQDSQLLLLTAVPPAPLPSEHPYTIANIQRTKQQKNEGFWTKTALISSVSGSRKLAQRFQGPRWLECVLITIRPQTIQVSGPDFSRAEKALLSLGFSPCASHFHRRTTWLRWLASTCGRRNSCSE